jgi:hypothetical protein
MSDIDTHRLIEVVRDFIITNRISCPEAVMEDRVLENAPDLVGTLCEIMGYYEHPDDDSEEA